MNTPGSQWKALQPCDRVELRPYQTSEQLLLSSALNGAGTVPACSPLAASEGTLPGGTHNDLEML